MKALGADAVGTFFQHAQCSATVSGDHFAEYRGGEAVIQNRPEGNVLPIRLGHVQTQRTTILMEGAKSAGVDDSFKILEHPLSVSRNAAVSKVLSAILLETMSLFSASTRIGKSRLQGCGLRLAHRRLGQRHWQLRAEVGSELSRPPMAMPLRRAFRDEHC